MSLSARDVSCRMGRETSATAGCFGVCAAAMTALDMSATKMVAAIPAAFLVAITRSSLWQVANRERSRATAKPEWVQCSGTGGRRKADTTSSNGKLVRCPKVPRQRVNVVFPC